MKTIKPNCVEPALSIRESINKQKIVNFIDNAHCAWNEQQLAPLKVQQCTMINEMGPIGSRCRDFKFATKTKLSGQ
jgi:hypothetical protein